MHTAAPSDCSLVVLCVMLPATMIEHKLTQFRCSQRASVRVIGGGGGGARFQYQLWPK
jgi:hypothetical protein